MKRYLAALLVVLGVVGVVGVLAVGTVFAEDENSAKAKCSKATLHGTYLFAYDGVDVYGEFDLFIAPDGSKLTFVQIKPSQQVASGFDLQGTAKRVGP